MLTENDRQEFLLLMREAARDVRPIAQIAQDIQGFIAKGLDQTTALQLLQSIRKDISSQEDDVILDIMDVVGGYCSPASKLFPEKNE